MLEQDGLWLGPWQLTPAGKASAAVGRAGRPAWTRPVLDLASRRQLGFVLRRAGLALPLLRWLTGYTLAVFETEDASLLCTLTRCWSPAWCWDVQDADGRRVAVVYRRLLLDGAGYRLARIVPADPAGNFLSPQGIELGTFRLAGGEAYLTFAPVLEREPFARMALLGATLALGD
jgi:hypothetical protein